MMLTAAPCSMRTARAARRVHSTRTVKLNSRSGRWTEQAESAATVKRLIDRDRKEFLGNAEMLEKYKAEFGAGDEDVAAAATAAAASPAADAATPPAASTAGPTAPPSSRAAPTPFSSAPPASPFGAPRAPPSPTSPFGAPVTQTSSKLEPSGLSPYMSPDPLNAEAGFSLKAMLGSINTVQVVLVLSFSTIIGLMIATFYVVTSVGAVRIAGLE